VRDHKQIYNPALKCYLLAAAPEFEEILSLMLGSTDRSKDALFVFSLRNIIKEIGKIF